THRKGRRLARVEVRATIGAPAALPDAVCLERLSGTPRDRRGCLTREARAFAKDAATRDALLSLAPFAHDWVRPPVAVRLPPAQAVDGRRDDQRTPAMAISLTDHSWT